VREPNRPLFAACEALLDFVKSRRPESPGDDDPAGELIFRTYIRGSKGFQGVFKLAFDGYGSQAFTIGRTVYEDMLVAHWIFLNPQEAPAKFRRHERLARYRLRLGRERADLPPSADESPDLEPTDLAELKAEFGRGGHWTGRTHANLRDAVRSEFEGNHRRLLEQVHEILHALSNLAVHHSYLSLDASVAVLPDGRRFADVGPSPTFVPQALFIGFFSYYHLVLLLLPEEHQRALLDLWNEHHGAFTQTRSGPD